MIYIINFNFKAAKTLNKYLLIIFVGIVISFLLFHEPASADSIESNPTGNIDVPKKNSEMIPFYWMVVIVGGCIIVTLSYVSWRKYKGIEKKQIKKKSNS